jgi:hypothetical protein
MATAHNSWLQQGFFVLGNEGLMPSVRAHLEQALNVSPGTLRISNYPVATNWKHTYWWREGGLEYAEAQFVAQIAKGYPVLSLGVAIEKGYETSQATTKPQQLMDRQTWDWPRFVEHVEQVLSSDVPAAAAKLAQPVTIRISTKLVVDGEGRGWQTRAFSFVDGTWFERYIGGVTAAEIASYVHELDPQKNLWAIVHFARDIGPAETEGLSAQQLAKVLLVFDSIRRRLKGVVVTEAV